MRAAVILAAVIAIAATPAASAHRTPAKAAFAGTIASASGRLAADRGKVAVDLAAPPAGQAARKLTLTLTFRSPRCGEKRHCVRLAGRLTGTLTAVYQRIPDLGRSFTVRAAGRLKPLGHVSATGTIQGTGFIARGHITMDLTLTARRGKVSVKAQTGPVPGFTSL